MSGQACAQDETCSTSTVTTSDSTTCCTGNCQDTSACTNDADCEDGDPNTYDFCYGVVDKTCEQIPEPIESHNSTKAREEALARSSLTDYCNEADIYNANAFTYGMLSYTQQELDEVNNGPPRTCGLQGIWGWCKDWWLECVDGQTRKIEQILTHKTPNQDNYTMAIKVNPWEVPV
jgi:hypothetical protein